MHANSVEPSGLTATQHGAVWLSANGEPPIAVRPPFAPTVYTDTEPAPPPSWAFETNRRSSSTGEKALPNGPIRWAANGEPGAAVSRPSAPIRNASRELGPAVRPPPRATSRPACG